MAKPVTTTVMSHKAVETLMSTVRELPTLPSIAARVSAVARDPDSTSRDMAAVICQGLVGPVLGKGQVGT